jgi:predicted nucleic-acid-binding protein
LKALLRSRQIVVERAEQELMALRVLGNGKAGFTDCLIERTATAPGCGRV